jgi:hypothetical protein
VIRSTFIAGFPGETETEFEELLAFLEAAELDRVGCFAYSPVDGAAANALPDPVPSAFREDRRARFMAVQARISARRLALRVGATMTVLVDGHEGNTAIARSSADAPEIDGIVRIAAGDRLAVGEFARVTVSAGDARLEAAIPTAVTRGIQLGLALLLVRTSVGFIIPDPLFSAIGIAIILVFLVITLYRDRIPDLSALVVVVIGVAAGIIINGLPEVQFLTTPSLVIPAPGDYIRALYTLVPSQALLTLTNAILATALLTKDLFRQEVPAPHLSRSIGIMNLISVPLGGFHITVP